MLNLYLELHKTFFISPLFDIRIRRRQEIFTDIFKRNYKKKMHKITFILSPKQRCIMLNKDFGFN